MGDVGESAESPILNFEGELVALGPLRRDLLPLYQVLQQPRHHAHPGSPIRG